MRRQDYEVVIELPKQILTVYAKDADDAVFTAWNMIGLAGVKHYGRITAAPASLSGPPARRV